MAVHAEGPQTTNSFKLRQLWWLKPSNLATYNTFSIQLHLDWRLSRLLQIQLSSNVIGKMIFSLLCFVTISNCLTIVTAASTSIQSRALLPDENHTVESLNILKSVNGSTGSQHNDILTWLCTYIYVAACTGSLDLCTLQLLIFSRWESICIHASYDVISSLFSFSRQLQLLEGRIAAHGFLD